VQPTILLHASHAPGAPRSWEAALLEALPYARRVGLARRPEDVRGASLAGIALLLLGASELAGKPVPPRGLRFPARRRPWLDGGPAFSVSHTAGRVACIVTAAGAPGLDLEWLGGDEDPVRTSRLRRWTAVEAVLKADGAGLRRAGEVQLDPALQHARLGTDHYALLELRLAGRWVAHVADRSPPRAPDVREVDLASPAVSATLERCVGLAPQFEQAGPQP
jgi:hypothetical protein